MDTWREAKRNYEAMLQVALHPGSGIDHGSLLFLRSKLLEAERKIHYYSTKPQEEVARAALANLGPAPSVAFSRSRSAGNRERGQTTYKIQYGLHAAK